MKLFFLAALLFASIAFTTSLKLKSVRFERFEVVNGTIKFFSIRYTIVGLPKLKVEDEKFDADTFESKEELDLAQSLSKETGKTLRFADIARTVLQNYFAPSASFKANGKWLIESFPKSDAIIIEEIEQKADEITVVARLFNLQPLHV
ncbi:hypothetical protein M3Y97_00712900 [Aphelenchoides bicaudatus]|nr:hypothetical protein M3Y97_00712900 [Aphelenchoides bicaudatus]